MAHDQRENLQNQRGVEVISTKDFPPVSLGKQLEKEKCMFMHCLRENRGANDSSGRSELSSVGIRTERSCSKKSGVLKKPPFRDVGNSSPLLVRQNSKAVYPLHNP
uniref:Uncharacterized protein n=1 Tax=Solanum lycopersicum TaxID=4081 RepID=A0A3Q7GW27_SOLLC